MTTPILVTGAAGRVGGIGRTITELLLKQGRAVRAMVRSDDQRAQALRDMGAEVVVGDLLDLDSLHRAIAGCESMYFGMSVSDTYLAATVLRTSSACLVYTSASRICSGPMDSCIIWLASSAARHRTRHVMSASGRRDPFGAGVRSRLALSSAAATCGERALRRVGPAVLMFPSTWSGRRSARRRVRPTGAPARLALHAARPRYRRLARQGPRRRSACCPAVHTSGHPD